MDYSDEHIEYLCDELYGENCHNLIDYQNLTINENELGELYFKVYQRTNFSIEGIMCCLTLVDENEHKTTIIEKKFPVDSEYSFYETIDYIIEHKDEIEKSLKSSF